LCVYTAHTHEILEDAETSFLREFRREDVRRSQERPTADRLAKINLITIQSLSRNLSAFQGLPVDYCVVDEFHHAAAKSYRDSIAALSPEFLLGLTATPDRGDRQDVLALCHGNVVVNYGLRQGIEQGVLCPYHYYGCFDNIDYTNIEHNGQRYSVRDLERALIVPERHAAVVNKWREKAEGKPTLAFCCSHRHADRVASAFDQEQVSATTYLSSTRYEQREQLRSRFMVGEIQVLCVVDVLNEGIDLPAVECLLFLRPTESPTVFYQQLGRGLRHYLGKHKCIVIDFIGNFRNAYKIVEYQQLRDSADPQIPILRGFSRSAKELLDLPAGCTVELDERVVDVFGRQTFDPAYASRHNIGRILIYQYRKFERELGRRPTKREVDRQCLLNSSLYEMVFGSWRDFERLIDDAQG
jgi:superfamily II DNA or RNA helicase